MEAPPFPAAAIMAARNAAKAHLRIIGSDEDGLIDQLAATALGLAEAFAGQVLILRDFTRTIAPAARWQRLDAEPVRAIGSVSRVLAGGGNEALAPGDYAIDIATDGSGWVRIMAAGAAGPVQVGFAAGLAADWTALPAPVAQGVVLLIAHLFNDRDNGAAPPAAVSALWRPWRRMRLAGQERAA